MLIWIPKRRKEGGWSFYSVTFPFSLIIIVAMLVVIMLLQLFGH